MFGHWLLLALAAAQQVPDPGDYAAHFNLALELSQQHKDPEAVAEYRKVLELKPKLFEADLNLGILLLRDNLPAEAVPVLKEALELRPEDQKVPRYYAQALLDSGHPAEAAERFRAYGDRDSLLRAATALEKAGDTATAIAIYKEFPDDPAVREHLGHLQIEANDAKGAIPNFEDAVKRAPTAANRLALADAYRQAGERLKMLEQLQAAAAAYPRDFDLHMTFGRALRDNRNLAAAASQFEIAAGIRPDAVDAWSELASALIVREDYAEGLTALDHIRSLGHETAGDFFFRAISCDKLKRKPEAVAAYKQFLTADSGAHPDQEFQARQRIRIIEGEMKK